MKREEILYFHKEQVVFKWEYLTFSQKLQIQTQPAHQKFWKYTKINDGMKIGFCLNFQFQISINYYKWGVKSK